jgi:hypothetical protein
VRRGAAAAALLLAAGCVAHLPREGEPAEFLEPTEVGALTAPHEYFEADGALHLVLWNGLGDPAVWSRGGVRTTGVLSLLAAIRTSSDVSAPVRLPTYEPRLMVEVLDVVPLGEDGRGAPGALAPRGVFGALVAFAHRSNGADGCALADHAPPVQGARDDFDCAALTDPPSTALNLRDGSFTTNYVSGRLAARVVWPTATGGPIAGAVAATLGAEWHPPGPPPFMAPEMRARHGPVVGLATLVGELEVLRERPVHLPLAGEVPLGATVRASAAGRLHLGADRGPFGGGWAQIALLPRSARGYGLGLFARRLFGSDPLNIRFEQALDAWMIGVIFDPSPLERVPAAPAPAP